MLTYLIVVLFGFFLVACYKKAIICLFIISPLLSHFALGDSDLFSILAILSIAFFCLKRRSLLEFDNLRDLPASKALLFVAASIITTAFFTGGFAHPFLILKIIITKILIVFAVYMVIKSDPERYVIFFVKTSVIFLLVISAYSVYETVTGTNPFMEFINDNKLYLYEKKLIMTIRYGVKRSQGLFSMHTTNGAVALLLGSLLLFVKKIDKHSLKNNLVKLALLLTGMTILFTGARSVIIGLAICLFVAMDKSFFSAKNSFTLIILFVFALFGFGSFFEEIFDSIVNTDHSDGSNSSMRLLQFQAAWQYFDQSFVFGNGIGFTALVAMKKNAFLLGAESLWFPIMIDYGILGVLCYIFFFYQLCTYVMRSKINSLLFFVVGFLIMNTLSSLPNFDILHISVYLYIMIKYSSLVENRNLRGV